MGNVKEGTSKSWKARCYEWNDQQRDRKRARRRIWYRDHKEEVKASKGDISGDLSSNQKLDTLISEHNFGTRLVDGCKMCGRDEQDDNN